MNDDDDDIVENASDNAADEADANDDDDDADDDDDDVVDCQWKIAGQIRQGAAEAAPGSNNSTCPSQLPSTYLPYTSQRGLCLG